MGRVIADTATTQPFYTLTVEAEGADEKFRRFIKADGSRAGARERPLGVCRVKSSVDAELIPVDVAGVVLAVAGAAIAADDWLESDAQGRAIPWSRPVINHAVVSGAAANADIAVTGITTEDTLDAVVATDGTAVPGPTIHSDGNIRSTGGTTGKHLLVVWRTPYRRPAARAVAAATAADDLVPVLLGGI